jgi:hypothetical protein
MHPTKKSFHILQETSDSLLYGVKYKLMFIKYRIFCLEQNERNFDLHGMLAHYNGTDLTEKLAVTQQGKKFCTFYGTKSLLLGSQESTIDPYPELVHNLPPSLFDSILILILVLQY